MCVNQSIHGIIGLANLASNNACLEMNTSILFWKNASHPNIYPKITHKTPARYPQMLKTDNCDALWATFGHFPEIQIASVQNCG
jgi:hypothetical protein